MLPRLCPSYTRVSNYSEMFKWINNQNLKEVLRYLFLSWTNNIRWMCWQPICSSSWLYSVRAKRSTQYVLRLMTSIVVTSIQNFLYIEQCSKETCTLFKDMSLAIRKEFYLQSEMSLIIAVILPWHSLSNSAIQMQLRFWLICHAQLN